MKLTNVSSAVPRMRVGWTKPSRPSVVSGESVSRGSAATRSAASLRLLTSLPLALPGCVPRPRILICDLLRGERLDLERADTRAVERVGQVGPELVEIEEVGASAGLLVDGEADANRRARASRGDARATRPPP